MTSKPAFKTTFAIIITAIFGYIMYLLIDSVNTGLFFTDESGKDVIILSAAFMGGPILLSIICCIIRKRYIGLLSILNLFLCASIGAALGEETTHAHIFVFAAMIIIPYILCLKMIIGKKIRKSVSALCSKFPKYLSGFVFSLNTWSQFFFSSL